MSWDTFWKLHSLQLTVRPKSIMCRLQVQPMGQMMEALPADVTDERLVEVGHPVRLQHADAGVALPADVAVAGLLPGVSSLHVQVAVSFVVEPLGAVVAGVRQQPVLFDLVFAEPQDAGERHPARRAHRVRLPLVIRESLCVWKQHPTLQTLVVTHCLLRHVGAFFLPSVAQFPAAYFTGSSLC